MTRRALIVFSLIGLGAFLASCLNEHDQVGPSNLPASWTAAIEPNDPGSHVDGTYANTGEYLHETVTTSRQRLSGLLFADLDHHTTVNQIRLRSSRGGDLQIEALALGHVVHSRTVAVESDPKTGAVTFSAPGQGGAGGNLAAAAMTTGKFTLYKGRDGDLYLKATSLTVGVIGVVVPMKVSTENWGHWPAAR